MRVQKHWTMKQSRREPVTIVRHAGARVAMSTLLVRAVPCCGSRVHSDHVKRKQISVVNEARDAFHVRSEGSVFLAGVRISGDNWAKIHAEPAVMMPTHRNVA